MEKNICDKELKKRFQSFHLENPDVYKLFEQYSLEVKHSGRKKYSAWTILQVIRWQKDLKTKGNLFKINNDFIALYARLLMEQNSELEGFFEIREMKKSKRKISKYESSKKTLAKTKSA
jgi:hypothetical protein